MKNNKNSISVIVPVYNAKKYLNQCIDSILNQSFSDFELFLVNDGSNDGSKEILDEYAKQDERVKVLHRMVSSRSAAVPRNEGLEVASGKYVIFLDADDYFDSTLFEKLYQRAEETDADMVLCDNYNLYGEDDEVSTEKTELHVELLPDLDVFSYKDIPDRIFQISSAAVWHRMYKRRMLSDKDIRFQEGVPKLDDIYFSNITTIRSSRIAVVNERLVYYRRGQKNSQTSGADSNPEAVYLNLKMVYENLKNHDDYELFKSSLQTWFILTLKWWLGCISSDDIYKELLLQYKNKYIPELGLEPMELAPEVNLYCRRIVEQILDGSFPILIKHFIRRPLEKVTRILLYGAGAEGKGVYELIKPLPTYEVVCWCDRNPCIYDGIQIEEPKKLSGSKDYDYAFIAINDPDAVQEVTETMCKYGIDETKIMSVII